MGKIRRGGYIFLSWIGDHTPKHVHVYRDQKFICKWDLINKKVMEGKISKQVLKYIEELQNEEKL